MQRREFVLSALALWGASHLAGADPDAPSQPARPPQPVVYPFRLGAWEAFSILDGVIVSTPVQPFYAPEAKPEEIGRLLAANDLPLDKISLCMNVLVLRDNSGVTLVDPGAGSAFGPLGGALPAGLAQAGIAPDQVTRVVLTHAHPDHLAGLLDPSGKPLFPRAEVYISRREADYWLDPKIDTSVYKVPATMVQFLLGTARKVLGKVNLKRCEYGQILQGIELIDAPGHTPGHSLVRFKSGAEHLVHIGDAVHVWALQFPRPEWTMAGDTSPPQAVTTRRKIFTQFAEQRTAVMGYHMPFPGLGRVDSVGKDAYRWAPRPWVS